MCVTIHFSPFFLQMQTMKMTRLAGEEVAMIAEKLSFPMTKKSSNTASQ